MRRKLFLFVLLVFPVCISAQTSRQKEIINLFFSEGIVQKLIQSSAHPTPDHNGIYVSDISNNSIYIKAKYKSFWHGSYTCTYKLNLNNEGQFLNLYVYSCSCPGFSECFDAFSASRLIGYMSGEGEPLTSDHSAVKMQERMRGKVLDRFSSSEILCCALFVCWYDSGCYNLY